MSKYTDGPWDVQKAEDCMGRKLDELVQWVVTAKDNDLWISTGPTWDIEHAEESMANARLIAAAPDLLDALEIAYHRLEDMLNGNDRRAWSEAAKSLFKIRKAIAKARGEA